MRSVGNKNRVVTESAQAAFSAKNLAPLLAKAGIGYSFYGAELGGRPSDLTLYRDGVADFEAMARQPAFQQAWARRQAWAAAVLP